MSKISESRTVKILKQLDKEEIPKAFAEIKKHADSPEAVQNVVNKLITNKLGITNPAGQAYASNYTNSMLLGEAAFDEIPELAIMSPLDRALKAREVSYGGMDKLRDSIKSEVLWEYPKLGNKVQISPEYNSNIWGSSSLPGIVLYQHPDIPLNFLLGVNLHEYGHQFDDATRLAIKKLQDLKSRGLNNPKIAAEFEKTKNALSDMWKKYPEIKSTIQDTDLPYFRSQPNNDIAPAAAQAMSLASTPAQFEKELTKGHMFKRNYEFDNLMRALKGGMRTVKGVGVGMIPAAAAGAIAAYAPDSMAGETAKTATKIMNEGDPLSMLTPENVNENEEAEVQKMIQEQKSKQAPGSTDNKWYGRRWSKVKDLLGK